MEKIEQFNLFGRKQHGQLQHIVEQQRTAKLAHRLL